MDLRTQRDPWRTPDGTCKSILDGNEIPDGQKDWLFEGLLNSTAAWKFLISSVPFNRTCLKSDGWAAYPDERQEIVSFIEDNSIDGVIVLSADIHSGGAIDDGHYADLPELSVPHLNHNLTYPRGCTAEHGCGYWSKGFIDGNVERQGLATVKIWSGDSDGMILRTDTLAGSEYSLQHQLWHPGVDR